MQFRRIIPPTRNKLQHDVVERVTAFKRAFLNGWNDSIKWFNNNNKKKKEANQGVRSVEQENTSVLNSVPFWSNDQVRSAAPVRQTMLSDRLIPVVARNSP